MKDRSNPCFMERKAAVYRATSLVMVVLRSGTDSAERRPYPHALQQLG